MALIMVLDDEMDACRLMQRVLARLGHEVEAFSQANSARRWLEDHEPDLVLLDMKLKDDDGLSILRLLRAQRPEVGVIIITGFPSAETAKEASQMGIDDYLVKPVELEELEHRVKMVLEKRMLVA
ncbi:response regulator [Desulfosoma caldarium]|uniref:Response regulator receiver domain-containing protein n=1 Tax=Desulfosoma caldarium TaxID=610254 RepID=A0A3N1UPS7_9BACT|nr:response regulator [Desulfosoma caldarium]ROQ90750.1 response regulator receiver domain-containing protein [Desulfosoma caldarium]